MQSKPPVIQQILADCCVGISQLKANPSAVIAEAEFNAVAVLNRNRPVAYVVSPKVWEQVMDLFEERRLAEEAREALAEDGEVVVIDLDAHL